MPGRGYVYRQPCPNAQWEAGIWVQSAGCRIGLPVMPVGAGWRRGPWSCCRTRPGWACRAGEAPGEGSGRVCPPAGCRRGSGRGGRAGRAGADRGAPRRTDLGRLGRIPGPWEQPCAWAGRRLPRGERHQDRDRRGGCPATSHSPASLPPSCSTAGAPWMLFLAPRRASCSRTSRACLTTSLTRRSPRGCVRTRAAPGTRPSWSTMRPPTGRRALLPARALSTATPAT
jgi:hypothetical protein